MIQSFVIQSWKKAVKLITYIVGVTGVLTVNAMAQYSGVGSANAYNLHSNYHVSFDRPEAWGLKYFASTSLLSGLQPPAPQEGYRVGSVTVGFEAGWLPQLDAGQRRNLHLEAARTVTAAQQRRAG